MVREIPKLPKKEWLDNDGIDFKPFKELIGKTVVIEDGIVYNSEKYGHKAITMLVAMDGKQFKTNTSSVGVIKRFEKLFSESDEPVRVKIEVGTDGTKQFYKFVSAL